jgi:hypothetical protein
VRVTTNFESRSWQSVLNTSLCGEICQLLPAGRLSSVGNSASFINSTDHHDVTEIVLKVALSTITLTLARFQYDETVINYNYLQAFPVKSISKTEIQSTFGNESSVVHYLVTSTEPQI